MSVILVTDIWRERKAREKQRLDAGLIESGKNHMDQLFPDDFLDRTEDLLRQYARSIHQCNVSADDFPSVMKIIKALVLALNEVNKKYGVIETDERELLCEYIDEVIIDRGIDIEDLARSQECARHELTDDWRDW